jgi:hypothetical protein
VQQGCPPNPQATQVLFWQIVGIGPDGPVVVVQAVPVGQQTWPSIPQGWQRPFWQETPGLQLLPAQHIWPSAPQVGETQRPC